MPRSIARRVQAVLMMPVPPMKRTFISYLYQSGNWQRCRVFHAFFAAGDAPALR